MASVECALGCGLPVNPHDAGTWKEVAGFVGGPRKDSMRLRSDTGRYAHDHCVEALNQGQAVDQPSILDEPEGEVTHDAGDADLPDVFKLGD